METPQPKKKNWFLKHKALSVILALVALSVIGAADGGKSAPTASNSSSTPNSTPASSATSSTTTTLKIGQPAADGKLQFTITGFQCSVNQIEQPDDTDYVVTQGAPYCVMKLSVEDTSTVSQSFDDDSQYLYDASSKQYSVDDDATIAANDSDSNFMEDPTVNPGVTLTGTIAFDIPAGVTPTYAMFHDSELSNGVKVSLQQ